LMLRSCTYTTHTISLHDALPISCRNASYGSWNSESSKSAARTHAILMSHLLHLPPYERFEQTSLLVAASIFEPTGDGRFVATGEDRKSTRLNSSHEWISYAVFCL